MADQRRVNIVARDLMELANLLWSHVVDVPELIDVDFVERLRHRGRWVGDDSWPI